MSLPNVVSESSRDLFAAAALAARQDEPLDEAWFSEAEVSGLRRMSSRPPPSPVVKVGEFVGDPEIDAWLR